MTRYHAHRAEGQVGNCVMIVAVCMLLSVFLTFASAYGLVSQAKRNCRTVLDNYVITEAIEIYNAVKQGKDTDNALKSDAFCEALASFCSLSKDGNAYISYGQDGSERYRINSLQLGYTDAGRLRVYASFTVSLPISFAGIRTGTASVPLTVTSKLEDKF